MAKVNLRDVLDAHAGGARVEEMTAWCPFGEEDFEVQLRHASAKEQRQHLHRRGRRKKVSDGEQSQFWLAHVIGWRNLEDSDGTQIEFTEQRALALWDIDSDFAAFIVEETQKLDTFLGRTSAQETAGGVPDESSSEPAPVGG